MKTNFTNLLAILILSFSVICGTSNIAVAQNNGGGNNTGNGNNGGTNNTGNNFSVSFTSTPSLITSAATALLPGAKYRFSDVANGMSAVVTIVSATGGATVAILDDNTLTKPEAFSPAINVPANSNGLVEFKIEYFTGNSNNTKTMDTLRATAMDIDGSGSLHEVDALNLGAGGVVSYMSTSPQISVIKSGNTFTATNIAGIEYTGVDTAAKQVMFTVTNNNVGSFIYKAGANNGYDYAVTRQKGIYFKGFNYTPTAALPVKLLCFGAVSAEKAITLNWITENEVNNDHFEVERSFSGNDFSQIALVLDGFDNGSRKNYSVKDNATNLLGKTVVYYRLKQIDKDGKFAYSNVVIVRMAAASDISLQVSPNPFVEKVTARFNSTTKTEAEIRIVNANGVAVQTMKTTVSKGYNNVQVNNLTSLPAGMYIATLIVDGKVAGTQKIIK